MSKHTLHFAGIPAEETREILREKIAHILSVRSNPWHITVRFSGKKYAAMRYGDNVYHVKAVEMVRKL